MKMWVALAITELFSNGTSDYQLDRYIHLSLRGHVLTLDSRSVCTESTNEFRYIVTELMATDLNTILKTKRVEDQFVQYFMYQLMVGTIYTSNPATVPRDTIF